jgi:hypothetical protein
MSPDVFTGSMTMKNPPGKIHSQKDAKKAAVWAIGQSALAKNGHFQSSFLEARAN